MLAFMLAVTSSLTHADPIVITSGSLSVSGFSGSPVYGFSGPNFSATGTGLEFGNTGPALCSPCVSGDVISPNSIFGGLALGFGTVTINGATFNNISIGGLLTFTGPGVIVPVTDSTSITLTTPFTLSGSIDGCLEPHLVCQTVVFSTAVSGSGIATIQLHGIVDSQGHVLFDFQSVTYSFTDTTVPEPASILFLTSGVAALAGAKLNRRRTKAP
jgi:hypothetical protein